MSVTNVKRIKYEKYRISENAEGSHLPASLPQWRELLETCKRTFKGQISLGDDPALFADRLRMLASVVDSSVERSVRDWISSGCWPPLSEDEGHFLLFRLVLATRIVAELAENNTGGVIHRAGAPPELWQRRDFAEWLLIKCWDDLGDFFLEYWAADVLNRHFSGSAEWE